jgi:hypothetical protein
MLHAPLFYMCRIITDAGFKKSDHYDAVLIALLFFGYPFYLLAIVIITCQYHLSGLLLVFVLPALAWCWLQVKHLFQ